MEERAGPEDFAPRPFSEHHCWLVMRAGDALGGALAEGLAPLGLNIRDYTVLSAAVRAAVEDAPRTQLALARAAGLDKSTMVVALDALEGKGLVQRRPHPKDRRARVVEPTEAGRRLLGSAEEVVTVAEDEALAGLGDDERRALKRILMRLLAEQRGADGNPAPSS